MKHAWIGLCFAVVGCASGSQSKTWAKADYEAEAQAIVDELAAARADHPYLAGLDPKALKSSGGEKLHLSLHYTHGKIGEKPNPAYQPGKKGSRTLPVWAADGVALQLYFFEGQWEGAAVVLPQKVGTMNVVALADGPREKEAVA